MSNRLACFLADLVSNKIVIESFKKDPEETMFAHGLTEEEVQTVMRRNNRDLHDAIGSRVADHLTQFTEVGFKKAKAKRALLAEKAKPAKKKAGKAKKAKKAGGRKGKK
jgi:hypothetical protein